MDFTFGGNHRLEQEIAIGGCGLSLAPFLFLFFCDLMEFAWTGTVFYGVHKVAGKEVTIKLEPVVEQQPSGWEFVAFRPHQTDQGRLFSCTSLCRCSAVLYCLCPLTFGPCVISPPLGPHHTPQNQHS